jgi:hypothetical protein
VLHDFLPSGRAAHRSELDYLCAEGCSGTSAWVSNYSAIGVPLGILYNAGRSAQRNIVCLHATNEHAGQRISMRGLNALYSAESGGWEVPGDTSTWRCDGDALRSAVLM